MLSMMRQGRRKEMQEEVMEYSGLKLSQQERSIIVVLSTMVGSVVEEMVRSLKLFSSFNNCLYRNFKTLESLP